MPELRHALVVDDNEINRRLARVMLTRLGWTVAEAASGEAALSACAGSDFPLILLDISMPGLSGQETCTLLRQRACLSRIIAYTAHAFPAERDKFLAGGFDDILVKPISLQSLGAVLDGL